MQTYTNPNKISAIYTDKKEIKRIQERIERKNLDLEFDTGILKTHSPLISESVDNLGTPRATRVSVKRLKRLLECFNETEIYLSPISFGFHKNAMLAIIQRDGYNDHGAKIGFLAPIITTDENIQKTKQVFQKEILESKGKETLKELPNYMSESTRTIRKIAGGQ